MILKRILQKSIALSGYMVTPLSSGIPKDMDALFRDIYPKCKEYTMTSLERMYSLYKAVEYIVNYKIPGDFVECGVWKGGSTMLIAHALRNMQITNRKIYLYDTFAGMSQPTEKDKATSDGSPARNTWKNKKRDGFVDWCYSPLDEVKHNMESTKYPSGQIVYVKGLVEDTIPQSMPNKISLLRLDTDWYDSTLHEIKHMYPILSKEGVLIIDDYGAWQGAKDAIDLYFQDKPILLNRIDFTGRIGIKPTN